MPDEVLKWIDQTHNKGANPARELLKKYHDDNRAVLIARASEEHKRRLMAVSKPHAMAWTLGPGLATPLTKGEYRAGLQWTLGVEVAEDGSKCQCGRVVDALGSHFPQCSLLDQRSHRHNQWRDTMADIVRKAGMAVHVEAKADDGTRKRPGDILIPGWRNGKPMAVDFAIIASPNPDAPDRTAHGKRVLYLHACEQAGWEFTPVIGDVYGAVRAESEKFLMSLGKHLAQSLQSRLRPTVPPTNSHLQSN